LRQFGLPNHRLAVSDKMQGRTLAELVHMAMLLKLQ
jgi:hypothetical protein